MDHEWAQGELQAYLDGVLPPDAARGVQAHLDACPACRAELALLREVDRALRAWPVLPAPEGLAARIMGNVAREAALPESARAPALWEAPWPWLREHWSKVLLGAALVATCVVVALTVRALGARGTWSATELRFWELQGRRALAVVERAWYALRAGRWPLGVETGSAGRGGWPAFAAQAYTWLAGAIAGAVVLGAGAAGLGFLAQQWRRGTPSGEARPTARGLA